MVVDMLNAVTVVAVAAAAIAKFQLGMFGVGAAADGALVAVGPLPVLTAVTAGPVGGGVGVGAGVGVGVGAGVGEGVAVGAGDAGAPAGSEEGWACPWACPQPASTDRARTHRSRDFLRRMTTRSPLIRRFQHGSTAGRERQCGKGYRLVSESLQSRGRRSPMAADTSSSPRARHPAMPTVRKKVSKNSSVFPWRPWFMAW